ncbi:MAG: DUF2497 domain-containing protein, partial [Stellaceae bacterium]
ILASIRRIIVEDNGPQNLGSASGSTVIQPASKSTAGGPSSRGGGITDPFRVAGTEPAIRPFPSVPPNMAPPQPNRAPPVQEAILDLTERLDDDDIKPTRAADPINAAPSMTAGRLNRPPPLKGGMPEGGAPQRLSGDAAASIAALTKIASVGQGTRQSELPLGEVGRTLEEMVRELLRPHLKDWLDANLPRLVERLVRDEINRLVREAQER